MGAGLVYIIEFHLKALFFDENGFPQGIFMIDDNWQNDYGNFDFKASRFPDPRGMIDSLHAMGFRVMLWISPYVSPDSPEFRELERKGYLLKTRRGAPAIVRWWNGYSACYDLTNPEAVAYLRGKLEENRSKYGTDGFKFDGGDVAYMQAEPYLYHDPEGDPNRYMQRWAELGGTFACNELRACWKLGGQPVVQRLGDKDYSWRALQLLIPDMTAAGLLGHPYTCPDMIGGGQFTSFLGVERFDEERESLLVSYDQRRKILLAAMLIVVRHFRDHGGAMPAERIRRRLNLPTRIVNDVLFQLVQAGQLIAVRSGDGEREVGYTPAYDIASMTIYSILEAVERSGQTSFDLAATPELAHIDRELDGLKEAARNAEDNVTLTDLMKDADTKQP